MRYAHNCRVDFLVVRFETVRLSERANLWRHTGSACARAEKQIRTAGIHPYRMGYIVSRGKARVVAEEYTVSLGIRELRRERHARRRRTCRGEFSVRIIYTG